MLLPRRPPGVAAQSVRLAEAPLQTRSRELLVLLLSLVTVWPLKQRFSVTSSLLAFHVSFSVTSLLRYQLPVRGSQLVALT